MVSAPHQNSRPSWIGPLAGWELLRLARRGQGHRGRLLVVYLMLIAAIVTPVFWFHDRDPVNLFLGPSQVLSPTESSEFSHRFVLVLMEAILLALVAMTPGYAAVAIADEKERQTLPLLLTTVLSDREIVLGKAAGRIVFVLIAAAAGFPILAALQLLGGVDGRFVLAGQGLIFGSAVLSAAIGIHAGCIMPDLRSAMVRAYAVTLVLVCAAFVPPFVLFAPFGVLVWLSGGDWIPYILAGILYPILQTFVAMGLVVDAIRRLRHVDPFALPPPVIPNRALREIDNRDLDHLEDHAVPPPPDRVISRPPVLEANPILWKERYISSRSSNDGTANASRLATMAFAALGLLLIGIGGFVLFDPYTADKSQPDEGGRLMMTGGVILLCLYLFPASVVLASAIARERRRQTLDPLLAIPIDRREILRTKVRAALERGWWWLSISLLATGLSFAADGGWLFGLAAATFLAAGSVFVVGLGALLTVRCPSEVRAFRFLMPAVVVMIGAPVGVWNSIDWDKVELPMIGLWNGAVVFCLVGLVLWRSARRALERLG